jgi:hypothetical protein
MPRKELPTLLEPHEEAVQRLAGRYGVVEEARVVKGLWRHYLGVVVRSWPRNSPWRLVRRLTVGGNERELLWKRAVDLGMEWRWLDREKWPGRAPRRITKDEERSKRIKKTESALRNWRRKLALAETKVKQYERSLRALRRAAQVSGNAETNEVDAAGV